MRRSTGIVLLLIALLTMFSAYVAWPGSRTVLGREAQVVRGLDLQGGLQVLLRARPGALDKLPEGKSPAEAMNDARQIIEQRVNSLGVSEPVVQRQGADRIVVELPGVKDPEQAIKTFQGTGLLEFVDAGDTPLQPDTVVTTSLGATGQQGAASPGQTPGAQATPASTAQAGAAETAPTPAATAAAPAPQGPTYQTIMTGADISSASIGFTETREPLVQFKLTGEGSKKFGTFTTNNVQKYLAIVLDKRVVSSPQIQQAITGGEGQITGVSRAEAETLAIQLRYGSLPVPLTIESSSTVGATLGQDSVDRSITAGTIGVIAVGIFMILYYRLPGVVSVVALAIYSVIVFALFKLIPITLTLAGIAGFVLSIGMAVDANVLIFARMKEELRRGRSLLQAVEAGFRNAWPSIRDSNVSTLITCAILVWFGSTFGASIIRGFAFTLAIGVIVSMFTAIVVTRSLLRIVVSIPAVRHIWLWGVERDEAGGTTAQRPGAALSSTRAQ